jgi:hypothetical protein
MYGPISSLRPSALMLTYDVYIVHDGALQIPVLTCSDIL